MDALRIDELREAQDHPRISDLETGDDNFSFLTVPSIIVGYRRESDTRLFSLVRLAR